MSQIATDIAEGIGTLVHGIGCAGLIPTGAALIVYHDVIDEETDCHVEICVPANGSVDEG